MRLIIVVNLPTVMIPESNQEYRYMYMVTRTKGGPIEDGMGYHEYEF